MNTCVCCGAPIPEGRQVCPNCEEKAEPNLITKQGIPVYLECSLQEFGCKIPGGFNPQLQIYKRLCQDRK